MVQVDLEELRKVWYNLGLKWETISGKNAEVFNSLDRWQKQELAHEYLKGNADFLEKSK